MNYTRINISEIPNGEDAASYIQSQINKAKNLVDVNSGQLVKIIIADGKYDITKTIRIPEGFTIAGQNQENTIFKFSNEYSDSNTSMFRTDNGSNFAGIERLSIDVNAHPSAGGVSIGGETTNQSVLNITYIGNPENANGPIKPVLSRGAFLRVGDGGVEGLSVQDNDISDVLSAIVLNKEGVSNVTISGNSIENFATHAITLSPVGNNPLHDIIISGNHIGVPSYGLSKYPIVVTVTNGEPAYNLTITDNEIVGSGQTHQDDSGFGSTNTNGTADQIAIRNTEGFIIADNDLQNSGEGGIPIRHDSHYGVISGNSLSDGQGMGISIAGWSKDFLPGEIEKPSHFIIAYNEIDSLNVNTPFIGPNAARTAIKVSHVDNVVIDSNIVRDGAEEGTTSGMYSGIGLIQTGARATSLNKNIDIGNNDIQLVSEILGRTKRDNFELHETTEIYSEWAERPDKYDLQNPNTNYFTGARQHTISYSSDLESNVQYVSGTAGNDLFVGTANIDRFIGGAGNDIFVAKSGDNIMVGGQGNDVFYTGGGKDVFIGGEGQDIVRFDNRHQAVGIHLEKSAFNDGAARGDIFVMIEKIHGTDFNDRIVGDFANNTFWGHGGDDTLYGRDGNDRLYGQSGQDALFGGTGDDLVVGGAGDDLLHGNAGNDQILGQSGDDLLYGAAGHDTLIGGAGADLLNGGSGHDLASYENASQQVRINLNNTNMNTGEADGDVYINIENLKGSQHNDIIYGNNAANKLYGESGEDRIYGGNGDDILYGQKGDDFLYGGGGDDYLSGSQGSDFLSGGDGADTFVIAGQAAFSGFDRIHDFSSAQGDQIVLKNVLVGYDALDDAITDFITLTENESHTYIRVDRDGDGDLYKSEVVARLNYVTNEWANIDDMIISGDFKVV